MEIRIKLIVKGLFPLLVLMPISSVWALSNEACRHWEEYLETSTSDKKHQARTEAKKLGEDYGYGLALYFGADFVRNRILNKRCSALIDELPS